MVGSGRAAGGGRDIITRQGYGDAEQGLIMRQSTKAFLKFCFLGSMLALFALGIWCIISSWPVPDNYLFGFLVLPCGVQFFDSSGDVWVREQHLARRWIHVLRQFPRLLDELHTVSTAKWTRILRCSVSVLKQNGEVCSADASVYSPGMCYSHLER